MTGALRGQLNGGAIAHRRPTDERAYHLFLKARYFWNQRTREGLETSLTHYREALELDPAFAAAFAGMAESYAFLWVHAGYQWAPMVAAAEEAALEALRIDPVSSDGHRSMGVVRIARNEFKAARSAFHQTLHLDPSDARARHWLAVVDAALGNLDDARAGITTALDVDPLSMTANQDYGRILYLSERYEDAVVQLRHSLEIAPQLHILT